MFQYLMTDGQVLGIVGWAGTIAGVASLGITIAGFWIAIAQLRRIKDSTQAAEAAVLKMAKVVKAREKSARLTHALSQLRIARAYLGSNPVASGAYLDTSCTSLLEARELAMSIEDQDKTMSHLARLRRIEGELRSSSSAAVPHNKLRGFTSDIQKASSDVETMINKIRFSFEDISVTS